MAKIKYKSNGVWKEIHSIKGDKGDRGEQGLKGDKGDRGEQGPAGEGVKEDLGVFSSNGGVQNWGITWNYAPPNVDLTKSYLMLWLRSISAPFVVQTSAWENNISGYVPYAEAVSDIAIPVDYKFSLRGSSFNSVSNNIYEGASWYLVLCSDEKAYTFAKQYLTKAATIMIQFEPVIIEDTTIKIQQARGTTSSLNNYTGKEGQVVVDTEKKSLRVMDGVTKGGFEVGGGKGEARGVNSGWYELPNGHIVQYGSITPTSTGTTVTFKKPFKDKPTILITPEKFTGSSTYAWIERKTKNDFRFISNIVLDSCFYQAIGEPATAVTLEEPVINDIPTILPKV